MRQWDTCKPVYLGVTYGGVWVDQPDGTQAWQPDKSKPVFYRPATKSPRDLGFYKVWSGKFDEWVVLDMTQLPRVNMTDEEAYSYHEQQAVRHMELAKSFADKLGKKYE